jgi:hypothetical protein
MNPLVPFGLCQVPCESRFHITLSYIRRAVQRKSRTCMSTLPGGRLADARPGESKSIHGSDLKPLGDIQFYMEGTLGTYSPDKYLKAKAVAPHDFGFQPISPWLTCRVASEPPA